MTELDRTWAESQIEAMAEGSLSGRAEQRMLDAMSRDAQLAAQVEQAKALRRELRKLGNVPVPRGLMWRLWRIPSKERANSRTLWLPSVAVASVAAAAIAANVFFGVQRPLPQDELRAETIEDFTIAMAYLQKSTLMAHNQINEAVGSGMLDALAMSRGMMDRSLTEDSEGE